MPKPKTRPGDDVQAKFYVDPNVYAKFCEICGDHGLSNSESVRRLLEFVVSIKRPNVRAKVLSMPVDLGPDDFAELDRLFGKRGK